MCSQPKPRGRTVPNSTAVSSEPTLRSALRLQEYLVTSHWDGRGLIGPDVGIRFNSRIGRFIKSYFHRARWNDNYYYLQAQGYWVLDNWRLFSICGEERFRDIAVRCSEFMLEQQREDGAWDYPNPEWRGRVATAEGTWGSIGLLESYRQTGDRRFLNAAQKWYRFVVHDIGFQQIGPEIAVNYFCGMKGLRVPNNSAITLRFLAELADASGGEFDATLANGLLNFLQAAQVTTGEFPYSLKGESGGKGWPHFQCYQYNAFICLDLMRYYDVTGDARVLRMIWRLLSFLRQALAANGHSFFDCSNRHQEVTYHTAVLAQAFARARQFGIGGYGLLADRAFTYLLNLQRPDGGYGFSRGDYFLLNDQRSYPRNLAMILYHLLPAERICRRKPAQPNPKTWEEECAWLYSMPSAEQRNFW